MIKQCELESLKERRERPITLILKPTSDCNLNCDYCYDKPARNKLHSLKMSEAILTHAIHLVNKHSNKVHILWHGGEPTLMGHEFYYKAFEIMSKCYTTEFTQSMQTNGVSILNDSTWLNTFNDCNIKAGTSYDASYSYRRCGTNEYDMRKSMMLLATNGISDVGGITVIHKDNLNNLVELYESIGESFKGDYSPCFNIGFCTDDLDSDLFDLKPLDVKISLEKLYNHMINDTSCNCMSDVSFLRNLGAIFNTPNNKLCDSKDCRGEFLTVLADGSMTLCSRFSSNHIFGNILDFDSIQDIYNSHEYLYLYNTIQNTLNEMCHNCRAKRVCNGGCYAKFIRGASRGISYHCNLQKSQLISAVNSFVSMNLEIQNKKVKLDICNNGILHPSFVQRWLREYRNIELEDVPYIHDLDINTLFENPLFHITRAFNEYINQLHVDTDLQMINWYESLKFQLEKVSVNIEHVIHGISKGELLEWM